MQIYHTKVIYDRLNRHLRRGSPYDEDVWFVSVLFGPKSFWFWLELLVNLLHMPFFVTTTFEISVRRADLKMPHGLGCTVFNHKRLDPTQSRFES